MEVSLLSSNRYKQRTKQIRKISGFHCFIGHKTFSQSCSNEGKIQSDEVVLWSTNNICKFDRDEIYLPCRANNQKTDHTIKC